MNRKIFAVNNFSSNMNNQLLIQKRKVNNQAYTPNLIYGNIDGKKLPEIFKPFQIQLMVETVDNSQAYLKTVWGDWMKARDKALLMTIFLLGLKSREACKLKFDDFDMEKKSFHIEGRGHKKWGKTRELPIPPKLFVYLEEYLSFPRERFWKGSPYLFPSAENNHISPE